MLSSKRRLDPDLVPTLREVLELSGASLSQQRLLGCLTESESCFELDIMSSAICASV